MTAPLPVTYARHDDAVYAAKHRSMDGTVWAVIDARPDAVELLVLDVDAAAAHLRAHPDAGMVAAFWYGQFSLAYTDQLDAVSPETLVRPRPQKVS